MEGAVTGPPQQQGEREEGRSIGTRGLRRLALASAVWLVCVAAAVLLQARENAHQRSAYEDRFQSRAETGASFVDAYVDDVFETVQRLAPVVTADITSPRTLPRQAALLGFPAAVLVDRSGRVVSAAPRGSAAPGGDAARRSPELRSALTGQQAVSDVVAGTGSADAVVDFAIPLFGARYGALAVGTSLEDSPLRDFLSRQPTAGSRGYILDSRSHDVVSPGDGSATTLSGADLAAARRGPTVLAGRLVAVSPVRGTSWSYVLDVPIQRVTASLAADAARGWGIVAGIALLALVILLVVDRAAAARLRARQEQAATDRRFRLTVEFAPVGMTMVGLDHRFIEPNARLCTMLGYSAEQLEAISFTEVTHPDDVDLDLTLADQLLRGETDHYELEKRYLRSDGSVLWGRLTVSMVRDDDLQPLYFVSQVEDVTEVRAAQGRLQRQALYDSLTALANRSLLIDRLEAALAVSDRGTVAVGYCDLDYFKEVNDQHGHHSGDAVLREVARRLRNVVRSRDTVARMGGDEFVLLLVDVPSRDDARRVMAAARQSVQRPIEVDGTSVTVGFSGGVAFAEPGDTADMLLRNADAAMYVAKDNGRGQYEIHGPDEPAQQPARRLR